MRTLALLIAPVAVCVTVMNSAEATPPAPRILPTLQDAKIINAENAWKNQDYKTAASLYQQICNERPVQSEFWFRLAYSQEKILKFDDAKINYSNAVRNGANPAITYLGLARVYALQSKLQDSLLHLEQSVKSGLDNINLLSKEPAFNPLRYNKKFNELSDIVKYPVLRMENGDLLNFWIGKWEYVSANGSVSGWSSVERLEDGSVVYEQWTSADGTKGESIYKYDKKTKEWKQSWLSSTGRVSERAVNILKNKIVLSGSSIYPDGSKLFEKETLQTQKDGTVRQTIEQSNDGKAWFEIADGVFRPADIRIKLKGSMPPPTR